MNQEQMIIGAERAEDLIIGAERSSSREFRISLEPLLWGIIAALFVGLRAAFVLRAPVSGAEWLHLSGAWQMSVGNDDPRFAGTLFQAATALLLHFTGSEILPRIIAAASSLAVPLVLGRYRSRFGPSTALVAAGLLALDASSLFISASASAMGFDLFVVAILAVMLLERPPFWAWVPAGFLVATSGPLILPFLVALAAAIILERREVDRRVTAAAAVGAILGIAATSTSFGTGLSGLTIAPFALFSSGFEQPWAGLTTLQSISLYSWPLLLVGLTAAALAVVRGVRGEGIHSTQRFLLLWAGTSGLWCLASFPSQNVASVVSVAMPLSLLAAPVLVSGVLAALRADWQSARVVLPAILISAGLVLTLLVRGSQPGHKTDLNETIAAIGFSIVLLSCVGYLFAESTTRATLLVPAALVLIAPVLSGITGVTSGDATEPMTSPSVSAQAEAIRAVALDEQKRSGGAIAVHPKLADELGWALRDMGIVTVASTPPQNASIYIAPQGVPVPERFNLLTGTWVISHEVNAPKAGLRDYIRWFTNRKSTDVTPQNVTIATRAR